MNINQAIQKLLDLYDAVEKDCGCSGIDSAFNEAGEAVETLRKMQMHGGISCYTCAYHHSDDTPNACHECLWRFIPEQTKPLNYEPA